MIVDREIQALLGGINAALDEGEGARLLLEHATLALLDYIEADPDGFRILVRDSPPGQSTGSFASVLGEVASQVEHLLASAFKQRGLDPKSAPIHAQMLVGMVALTGQWWLEQRKFKKDQVAAHLVNLAWNGLSGLDRTPRLISLPRR